MVDLVKKGKARLTALALEPLFEFIRHSLLDLARRVLECRMEQTFENVFGHTSSVHGRVVPGRDHQTDSVFHDDTGDSTCRFVENETEVILAQKA